MTIESFPDFTAAAAKLWATVPAAAKNLLLANAYCSHCRGAVTMTNFSGVVRGGDLLLVGKCAECQGDVARVVEVD